MLSSSWAYYTACLFGMADPASLAHLYKCLILPILDYCSVVWDPAAAFLINLFRDLQQG